jgi:hypothetical protein
LRRDGAVGQCLVGFLDRVGELLCRLVCLLLSFLANPILPPSFCSVICRYPS